MAGHKKKGPARKLPKRRSREAQELQQGQYRQRREPMWGDKEHRYDHRRAHRFDNLDDSY